VEICTIGSSGSSAEEFFLKLDGAGVTALIDTRANHNSQLSGFAKSDSLKFFITTIFDIPYLNEEMLVPRKDSLENYRKDRTTWYQYSKEYLVDLESRSIHKELDISKWGDRPVLLCSEKLPNNCHRRIAAEYLAAKLTEVTDVIHL
jgi:uncharacterized protein (DUF488 family)